MHDAQTYLYPDSSRLPDPVIHYHELLNINADKLPKAKAETVHQHLPHLSPQFPQIPPQLLDSLLQTRVCKAKLQMQKSDPYATCTYVCLHPHKQISYKAFLIYITHFPVHCVLKSISWQFIAESECYNVHIHLRTSCGAYVRTYMCNFPTITNYQSCMPLYVRMYARCWFDIHKNSILHTAYGQQL